jgi:glycosyltransferase involved in cell wall biosynthesis
MKIALSLLCENPRRKTGLSSTYHEMVARSLKLDPEVSWIVFVGPRQDWQVADARVQVVRDFPANDQLKQRLFADHFRVPPRARALGADLILSTGFVPARKCLPTAMHVFALQHLDRRNKVGFARALYRRVVMNWSWRRADLVITNSKFAQRQILDVFPEFHDRLVQSYEGLQHEIFRTDGRPGEWEKLETHLQTSPGYILWLSNFYPYKQAELLLAGFARLEPALRQRHPLVMVGGDWENQIARNRECAHQLGITSDVKFLGWVTDDLIAPLYRHASLHCLPSREETFGRTVIESMACGTPVLVNDIPIMHEVTAGQGLIVDFTNTEAVTNALRQILTDEPLRQRLREGGLARARQFSFERFTAERLTAIRRMMSRPLANPSAPTQPSHAKAE